MEEVTDRKKSARKPNILARLWPLWKGSREVGGRRAKSTSYCTVHEENGYR